MCPGATSEVEALHSTDLLAWPDRTDPEAWPDRTDPEAWTDPGAWPDRTDPAGGRLAGTIALQMGTRLRRHSSPEDILQETLLHAWRNRAALPHVPPGAIGGWLLAVARNRVRDAADACASAKRGGHLSRPVMTLGLAIATVADRRSVTPDEAVAQRETEARVRAAVARLPGGHRRVLELLFWSGLAPREAARRLGLNAAAIRRRCRQGLGLLRDALAACAN